MYSAYHCGQFASRCPPVRFSCSPWAASARRSALARSAVDANAVSAVDPPGQPRRDLLQQPAVAVRVAERGERAVAGVVGRGSADATARADGLELSARRPGVEHLADFDTAGDEFLARSLDVGDDQVEALGGAGRGRSPLLARRGGCGTKKKSRQPP